jgi:hypothetical protein
MVHLTRVQQRIGAWFTATLAATRRDDRGAFTTETAIITGVLAAIAIAVGVTLMTKATNWANAIPDP